MLWCVVWFKTLANWAGSSVDQVQHCYPPQYKGALRVHVPSQAYKAIRHIIEFRQTHPAFSMRGSWVKTVWVTTGVRGLAVIIQHPFPMVWKLRNPSAIM